MDADGRRAARGLGHRCFVSPGNDDQFEVDEIVAAAKRVELAEGQVVEFGDFQMVSTGWSNRTPWDTYREEDEDAFAERLRKMTSQVTAPPERTIYNFHCPPYGTGLDEAPELNENMRPKHGGRSIVPVGSKAVREAIEEGQPARVARAHPRGQGEHPHRQHAVHQPGQLLRAGAVARRGGKPGRQKGQTVRSDQRIRRQQMANNTTAGTERRPLPAKGHRALARLVGVGRLHLRGVLDQPDHARLRPSPTPRLFPAAR